MTSLDTKTLWEKACVEIELSVSKANFTTWFKHTSIGKYDDGTVYLYVPNAFVREWLVNKYHKLVLRSLRSSCESVRSLEYIIHKVEEKEREAALPINESAIFGNQMAMQELYVSTEDNLNPRYLFDNFIVGTFNELAHAASQSVVRNPGAVYNPLFIYGGTGLGKTHLIQSVGNYFKKMGSRRVYYLTSERYASEYVESVRANKVHFFKEKYKKYDVLIIDDIQFLSGMDKTQEELFHLFNNFHENNKQIVFSSDKPPKHIPEIEARLRSRFEGGMIVDIQKPDFETRLAILKSKLASSPYPVSEEVVKHIAESVTDNIRELEGALNTIVCQCQLKKRDLTQQEIKSVLKNSTRPSKSVSMKDVINTVANYYNVTEEMLYEKTRRKDVVKPRQIVMYILREDFNTSYPHIGQKMGGRDHTTVIHAYEKIKGDLKRDSRLAGEIDAIKNMLYRTSDKGDQMPVPNAVVL